ncbi:hypothetical protein DL93DRAFT_2089288, partial [Clavulina sp. PMI_390]
MYMSAAHVYIAIILIFFVEGIRCSCRILVNYIWTRACDLRLAKSSQEVRPAATL